MGDVPLLLAAAVIVATSLLAAVCGYAYGLVTAERRLEAEYQRLADSWERFDCEHAACRLADSLAGDDQ